MRLYKKRGSALLIGFGAALIVAAIVLAAYNIWDDSRAARERNMILDSLKISVNESTAIPDYILDPNMDMPTIEVDGYKYIGKLTVPTFGLELPVMDSWSYPRLKISPCRYSGSAYLNNMVVAAHNYTSHFGQLKNLHLGDEIIFTDIDGNVFNYEVIEVETLGSTAVAEMTNGSWDMTLFTCTIGGRSRVTVRCKRIL